MVLVGRALLLLLLLLRVRDLHRALLLLAGEEGEEAVVDVVRRRALLELLLDDVAEEVRHEAGRDRRARDGAARAPRELGLQDVREDAARDGRAEDRAAERRLVRLDLAADGALHLLDEDVDDCVDVVERVLRQVVERDEGLVDGGEVARHLLVAVALVEAPREAEGAHVREAAACGLRLGVGAHRALVEGEARGVHRARAAHRLPDLGEVVDIVREDEAAVEERRAEAPLVDELEGHVLADDVAVVDEEEDLLAQRRAVRLAEVVVELLVELDVVVGEQVEDPVAAVGLVDVVEVDEAVGAEAREDEVADRLDGRLLDDAAEVDERVEAQRGIRARARARARAAAAARPSLSKTCARMASSSVVVCIKSDGAYSTSTESFRPWKRVKRSLNSAAGSASAAYA